VMAFMLETSLPMHLGLLERFPELHRATMAFFSADGVRDYVRSDRRCRTLTISLATFAGKPEETHQFA
jgi:glutathione S-transferase